MFLIDCIKLLYAGNYQAIVVHFSRLLWYYFHVKLIKKKTMKSVEEIQELISKPGLAEAIREGAPHRAKIISDIGPKMRDVKDRFVDLFVEADWKNGKTVVAKAKEDKKDAQAQADLKEWKKRAMNLFRAALKTIHPNENQTPSVSMLYLAGPVLEAIGRRDLIENNPNYDPDQPLKIYSLDKSTPFFASESARGKLAAIMSEADEVQGEMCRENDAIKYDAFAIVPPELKYDKSNKKGIREGDFQKLVRTKAMRDLKDSKTFEKYVAWQLTTSEDSIDRETFVLAKTKDI